MITELLQGMDNLIEGVTDDMPDTITDWQTDADKHGFSTGNNRFKKTKKEISKSRRKAFLKTDKGKLAQKKYRLNQKDYQKKYHKGYKQKKFWKDFKKQFNIELTELLHGMDNLIEDYATAAGTSGGAKKGWLTRQHGPDIATRKKHGKFSKWLHEWAKDYANTLQLDDDFVKKHPEDWIQQSYKQAYRLARKKFF